MIVGVNVVSLFAQVLSIIGVFLALGALVFFLSKVHKTAGKREGAQNRMQAKLIAITLIIIAGVLQAIAYSIQ